MKGLLLLDAGHIFLPFADGLIDFSGCLRRVFPLDWLAIRAQILARKREPGDCESVSMLLEDVLARAHPDLHHDTAERLIESLSREPPTPEAKRLMQEFRGSIYSDFPASLIHDFVRHNDLRLEGLSTLDQRGQWLSRCPSVAALFPEFKGNAMMSTDLESTKNESGRIFGPSYV